MRTIMNEWREYISEQKLSLSPKEKAEAKQLLDLRGFSLKKRIEMVMQMGAGATYNNIAGAFLGGVFGEPGVSKGNEMQELFPNLQPVTGEWAQDDGGEVAEFDKGAFLNKEEYGQLERLAKIYRDTGDLGTVARQIETSARANADSRGYVHKLHALMQRLKEFGSYIDNTRGISLANGGAGRAERVGYIELENGEKMRTQKGSGWHRRFMGTRSHANKLLKALNYVDVNRR